jgi:hypothetical protein
MPEIMEERIRQVPKKCTIMKARVGCVKTSAYHLPPPDHTFGYTPASDAEGAGDSMFHQIHVYVPFFEMSFTSVFPFAFVQSYHIGSPPTPPQGKSRRRAMSTRIYWRLRMGVYFMN